MAPLIQQSEGRSASGRPIAMYAHRDPLGWVLACRPRRLARSAGKPLASRRHVRTCRIIAAALASRRAFTAALV